MGAKFPERPITPDARCLRIGRGVQRGAPYDAIRSLALLRRPSLLSHAMEVHMMREAQASIDAISMKPEPGILIWMSIAFCIALALAIAVLAAFGANARGIEIALRLTARWSFLLFFAAYVGGAACAVFGPTFSFLARHQRQFGLSFASAHLVHIGIALWVYGRPDLKFGIGTLCIYVLALYSIDSVRKMMNPGLWRIVRFIGLQYIAYLFFIDLTLPLFKGVKHPIEYLPFAILIVLGVCLRIAAWTFTRKWKNDLQGPALTDKQLNYGGAPFNSRRSSFSRSALAHKSKLNAND